MDKQQLLRLHEEWRPYYMA